MDEDKKKKLNDAIEMMRAICDANNEDNCDADCPLWWNCGAQIFDWEKID